MVGKKCVAVVAVLALLASTLWVCAEPAVYPVANESDWDTAIQAIEQNGGDALIQLKGNITLTNVSEIGIPNASLQIESEGQTPFCLTVGSDELMLQGDVTFKNVYLSAHTIYAQGHALTLGEGFGGGQDGQRRMSVYGGSNQDLNLNGGSTHIVVSSGLYKLIAGGNSSGTLTGDTYIEFGGDARFPTAADGKQSGDYTRGSTENDNIYFDAEIEADWTPVLVSYYKTGYLPYGIYGGGTCGNTVGSTKVVMTGGEVYQIFGGGAARRNPNYASQEEQADPLLNLGRVSGNTSVTVSGGKVKSVYGGGYNDLAAFAGDDYQDGVPADAREQRAVVDGDTWVNITGTAYVPATEKGEDTSTASVDVPAVYGGSFHSCVRNTKVLISGDARIESGEKTDGNGYGYGIVYGAGCDDIVNGTTYVELLGNAVVGSDKNQPGSNVLSQGSFGAVTPLGRSSSSTYLGGAKCSDSCVIRNSEAAPYAATAVVSGGSTDVLMAGVKSRLASRPTANIVQGNVCLAQAGGELRAIEAGSIENKKVKIQGNVDIQITGGTVTDYILGHYPSFGKFPTSGNNIKGACTLTFSGCGQKTNAYVSPLIQFVNTMQVENGTHMAVYGDFWVYDYDEKTLKKAPLWNVEDLTVDAGATLAFRQKANILGDLTMNGALNLCRENDTAAGKEIATFTADGTANGTGTLLPISFSDSADTDYFRFSVPVAGEEYVYADAAGSSMVLTLGKTSGGLFVDRKASSAAGQDVWFINEKEEEQIAPPQSKPVQENKANPKTGFEQ